MSVDPQLSSTAPAQDPGEEDLYAAYQSLRDVLPYAHGSHYALPIEGRVHVVSYRGAVLGAPWVHVHDPGAADVVSMVMRQAGIQAELSAQDRGSTRLTMVLATAADVNALTELLARKMSSCERLAIDLVQTLREAGVSYPTHGAVHSDRILKLKLKLSDVQRIRTAFGEPDGELTASGAELYPLAKDLATQLSRELGGEVTVTAYPAREDDRENWLDELLVVDWLSLDQARRLVSKLRQEAAA